VLSLPTLNLLSDLLNGQQLAVGAEDFSETVGVVLTAKTELAAEIEDRVLGTPEGG
jgi:hypothetical protein